MYISKSESEEAKKIWQDVNDVADNAPDWVKEIVLKSLEKTKSRMTASNNE